ncbi:hypothetical protein ACOME3_005109 [Neoechinorhynchus agilis]
MVISLEATILVVNCWLESSSLLKMIDFASDGVVPGVQAYFPIPFQYYSPCLVNNTNGIVHKDTGWFNPYNYDYMAFYGKDLMGNNGTVFNILRDNGIHIIHAPEPQLRVLYHQPVCSDFQNELCKKQQRRSLAPKTLLAQLSL